MCFPFKSLGKLQSINLYFHGAKTSAMLYFIIYLPKLWLRFLLTPPDGADSQERYKYLQVHYCEWLVIKAAVTW